PPMVALSAAPDFEGPNVRADEHRAGYLLTRHLLELGHQRITFIGPPPATGSGTRQAGYVQAMQEAGLEPSLVETYPAPAPARQAAADLLSQPDRSTALIAFNDYMALGVLRAAAEANLKVPADVSVAGFDNLISSAFYCPPLTTVDLETEEIAVRAVEILLRSLQSGGGEAEDVGDKAQVVTLAPTLVVRESTGKALSQ
ncbi:MAG: substrate-binding domain-containing protein, partial [Armatimonadetes bacterium]|nr:substrate-binding domain-containing protein [Armatimonadota bacterium]